MPDIYRIQGITMRSIVDAIHEKNGESDGYTAAQIPKKILEIPSGGGEPERVEWHQCPELVRSYLDQVQYDPGDYSVSRIANYAPAVAVLANTKPIGYTVDGIVYQNNAPLTTTPFASANKAGTVKPLDRLRWIEAGNDSSGNPFCRNMRDLGGWPCDGGTIRYGLIYRCGQPSRFARAVLVEQLGIRGELDLQGQDSTATSSLLGADVDYCRPPAYQWYTLANRDAWKEILSFIIRSAKYGRSMIFHCSAGADRTGTVACVVEALLGLSQSDIDKDYELTSFYTGTDTDAHARRRNEAEWRGLIAELTAVPLVGGLADSLRNRAVSFALSLGIGIDEINAFRAAMINGQPEAITVTMASYQVVNNLTNATTDNESTEAAQFGGYNATITPDDGYLIKAATVAMGDAEITASAFVAESMPMQRGIVAIPLVSGNISITVTAEKEVLPYHNLINSGVDKTGTEIGYSPNLRLDSSCNVVASQAGYTQYCTYYIPLPPDVAGNAAGAIVRLRGIPLSKTMDNIAKYNIGLCTITGGAVTNIISTNVGNTVFDSKSSAYKIYNAVFSADTGYLEEFAIGSPSAAATHIAFTIPVPRNSDMIITVNEEVD